MAAGDDPTVLGLEGEITVRIRGADQPGEVKLFVRGTYERFMAHSATPIQVGVRVRVDAGHGPRAVDVVPVLVTGGSIAPAPDPQAPADIPQRVDAVLQEHGGVLPEAAREQLRAIRAGLFTLTRYPLSDTGTRRVNAVAGAVVERVRAHLNLVRPNAEDERRLTEQLHLLAGHVDDLLDDLDRDLRSGIRAMDAGLEQRFRGSQLDLPEQE